MYQNSPLASSPTAPFVIPDPCCPRQCATLRTSWRFWPSNSCSLVPSQRIIPPVHIQTVLATTSWNCSVQVFSFPPIIYPPTYHTRPHRSPPACDAHLRQPCTTLDPPPHPTQYSFRHKRNYHPLQGLASPWGHITTNSLEGTRNNHVR